MSSITLLAGTWLGRFAFSLALLGRLVVASLPVHAAGPDLPPDSEAQSTESPGAVAGTREQLPPDPGRVSCLAGSTRRIADVQARGLPEASALVASHQWPGVYWTLNDHGNDPALIAFDEQGQWRGTIRVSKAENVDWEALQLGPGPDGSPALYVGDVGDNDGRRHEVVIYRLSEPPPAPAAGGQSAASTAHAEAFRVAYPDGPHNAEALLVHSTTGEVVVITKDPSGHSTVYGLSGPLDGSQRGTLRRVGEVDVSSMSAPGNLITDASVSPDARHVAVRTYSSALEYDLAEGASLASIWGQTPRIIPLVDGPKGEGITYRADGSALMSIGEGSPAALYATPSPC